MSTLSLHFASMSSRIGACTPATANCMRAVAHPGRTQDRWQVSGCALSCLRSASVGNASSTFSFLQPRLGPACPCVTSAWPRVRRASMRCLAAAAGEDPLRSTKPGTQQLKAGPRGGKSDGNGLFALLLLNIAIFVLQHPLQQSWLSILWLNHAHPRWWQFLTNSFCHASWAHLSSNLFGLYVFGRSVEEDEGGAAVWLTYVACAIGASVASYFLLPRNSVSLGASGAVFGLFGVSVLVKLAAGFNLKKLIEAGILGQYVVAQLSQEMSAQATVMKGGAMIGASAVSHVAHLAGAAVGVLLVFALTRLPETPELP